MTQFSKFRSSLNYSKSFKMSSVTKLLLQNLKKLTRIFNFVSRRFISNSSSSKTGGNLLIIKKYFSNNFFEENNEKSESLTRKKDPSDIDKLCRYETDTLEGYVNDMNYIKTKCRVNSISWKKKKIEKPLTTRKK